MTIRVIGFGGTYYTGWEMVEEQRDLGNGRSYVIEHWHYCRNLSKDPSIAREKWNTDSIDMDLRGHRSFDRERYPDVETGCFRYGKFRGQPYDVADGGYLGWYFDNGVVDDEREAIENLLIEKHNWVRTPDGRCISAESWEAEEKWNAMEKRTKDIVHGTAPIKFVAEYNLNEYGELMVRDDVEFCVKFKDWKEFWYNGWPYGLPLDKKGKAKRIKNKTLVIKTWNILSDSCVEPVEWEVEK